MFNNNPYLNRMYHQQRQEELICQAEHKRLLRDLRQKRVIGVRLHQPALALLGRWLVLSGLYLQRKSGVLVEASQTHRIKTASSMRSA